ncbi:MAG: 50S ribosomal protein L22 [Clostridia bacterium]|nr:50S ribosomal protein L22 [Clostridia bacterium]
MAKRMKEKKEERLANKDMRPRATASFVRMSPSKVARVLDGIRGKKYKDALAILELAPYSSAEEVKEVMNSAASNAEHNLGMNREDLYVAECYANAGAMLKRMMPRAKGRGVRILKRTTHITVVLDTAK